MSIDPDAPGHRHSLTTPLLAGRLSLGRFLLAGRPVTYGPDCTESVASTTAGGRTDWPGGEPLRQEWRPMSVLVLLLGVVVALLAVLVTGLLRSHAEILRGAPRARRRSRPRGRARRARCSRHARHARWGAPPARRFPDGGRHRRRVAGRRRRLHRGRGRRAPDPARVPDERLHDVRRVLERVRRRPPLAGSRWSRLVVVTQGPEAESPARLQKFVPRDVPVVMSSAAWDAYDVPVAPYFAFVDGGSGAVVGEGAAGTWDHLPAMLDQALADAGRRVARGRRHRARAGSRAPRGARGRPAPRRGNRARRSEPLPGPGSQPGSGGARVISRA